TFSPTDGRRLAIGEIGVDGTYSLTTFEPGDGAFVGEHKVTISIARSLPPRKPPTDLTGEGHAPPPGVVWIVPEKYSIEGQSGLTATVERGKANAIDFPLP